MSTDKKSLIGLDIDQLKEVAEEIGLKSFAANQMAQWLYQKRVTSIDEMTNLSKDAREKLAKKYTVGREEPLMRTLSSDGTAKYLFKGRNGRNIESVMIPDKERATLCISSQAGCKMNCSFCLTGRNGYDGDLSSAQIINQILSVPESEDLTNIVFMGMGEPLDNLEPVLKVIKILTSNWGLAWSPKRITVSTIGKLRELKTLLDKTQVHIAISVHTPFSKEREQIMPVEKAFPLRQVISLLRDYDFAHQRRLSVEYIMWKGYNDDETHAETLAKILAGTSARVNLIRFHEFPGCRLHTSDDETMVAFRQKLNQLGVTATIRSSRGEDILAACGQLAGKKEASSADNAAVRSNTREDIQKPNPKSNFTRVENKAPKAPSTTKGITTGKTAVKNKDSKPTSLSKSGKATTPSRTTRDSKGVRDAKNTKDTRSSRNPKGSPSGKESSTRSSKGGAPIKGGKSTAPSRGNVPRKGPRK